MEVVQQSVTAYADSSSQAACMEGNRLLPIPEGASRRELYCQHCTRQHCIFGERKDHSPKETLSEAQRRRALDRRARGLDARGRPLIHSCWNCVDLEERVYPDKLRYRCHRGLSKEGSEYTAKKPNTCPEFQLRREILWREYVDAD